MVITPTIQSEDKERVYDYIWMCYDKNDFWQKYRYFVFRERFGLYGFVVIVFLHQLIFAYRDRETEITKYVYSSLSVESQKFQRLVCIEGERGY